MLKLRWNRIKANLQVIFLCWILTAICAFFALPAFMERNPSPVPLTEVNFSGDIDGLYVSGTLHYIHDCYSETVKSNLILAKQYLISLDNSYYMGLLASSEEDMAAADALMDATYAYANAWDDGTKLEDASFEVTGTIHKLRGKSLKLYKESLDWERLDSQTQEHILPYYIKIGSTWRMPKPLAITLVVIGSLSFLFSLLFIPELFYKSKLEKYVRQSANPILTRQTIEDFLENTPEFAQLRYDEDFICNDTGNAFGEIKTLVWAYKKPGKYSSSLMLGFLEGDVVTACIAEDALIDEHLYCIEEFYPHVITEYSKDLEKLYRENRKAFLNQRYYLNR